MKASLKAGSSSLMESKSKSGRLPQAPASLLVQLPPDELKKFQNASTSGGNEDLFEAGSGGVEASDLHLLATSIHQRREREARVFVWQQRLIDADERLSRSDLKRALTQLSLSSWLQVLQERHLDNRCTYPTCSRMPMKPHLSMRETVLPPDAPRYRISLSKRTIKRDERDDAGGENGYCTKACWRRGEWISRWVLEGNMINRQENQKQAAKPDQEFGSVIDSKKDGLGAEVDEGGRWERLIDEDNWQKVELLEDLEDDGQVDRLSDDESAPMVRHSHSQTATAPSPSLQEVPYQADASQSSASQTLIKDDLEGFSTMLDSLEIVERPPGQTNARKPVAIEQIEEKPLKQSLPRRLRKMEQEKMTHQDKDNEEAHISDVDSDDMDVLGELSLRSGGENGDDVVSTILRSSRNLKRVEDDQESEAPEALTEEELKRYKEEDDLFAQAWQARDEERAKGSWEE